MTSRLELLIDQLNDNNKE